MTDLTARDVQIAFASEAHRQAKIAEFFDDPFAEETQAGLTAKLGQSAASAAAAAEGDLKNLAEAAGDTATSIRSLAAAITSGTVDLEDAREQLSQHRSQLARWARDVPSLASRVEATAAAKADPAAHRAALEDKYPLLANGRAR